MKKLILLIMCLFVNIGVQAEELTVKFSKCVDGDTAKFIYKNEEITARFLAIDTPESVHPTIGVEEYGKEASNYTCEALKKADEIVLEFDENSDKTDKYNRYLVWVFIDGKLLQKELIKLGYAEVAYLYDDYKYTNELEIEQEKAMEKKIGIWSSDSVQDTPKEKKTIETSITNVYDAKYNNYIIIAIVTVVALIFIFSEKGRKAIIRKTKSAIKKELKK